ncbi:unnamed protein product [Cladocopium goreaui]|uniref:CCHC-type domain-containing protein n=1 Tax=Cladocopium goreaui TaxID=2562237 RepID=A0A9P1BS81_9DINO|nr:unnamed protein product [Cladocopium goreaui]
MADTVQSDEDLAAAFTSYSEARKRLSDRFKNRGFWPVGPNKGKGKGYSNKGRGKSFGKFPKKSLQQRILESSCRICGKKGHWKAECPERSRGSASTSAAGTSAAMTTTAEPLDDASEPNALPMEFMQLNENLAEKHTEIRNDCTPFESEMILFSTHGTSGILDTGATKSVIGSKLLPAFIESLPHDVRKASINSERQVLSSPRPPQPSSLNLYRAFRIAKAMSLASRMDRVMAQTSPDVIAAFEQKTLEEMGNCKIAFGKAHVGKSYLEMWEQEKSWMKWFIRTYSDSQREEHKKLIIYVEKMVQQLEISNGLPTLEETETQQGIVQPRCKVHPKAKASAHMTNQAPFDAMTVMSEDPNDPWDVMEQIHTVPVTMQYQEDMNAMQNRVLAVENALTEILQPAEGGFEVSAWAIRLRSVFPFAVASIQVWYSLPGLCPTTPLVAKATCTTMPGGRCARPSGAMDCTWSAEKAGELKLSDVEDVANWTDFCLHHGNEYILPFWDGRGDTAHMKMRMSKAGAPVGAAGTPLDGKGNRTDRAEGAGDAVGDAVGDGEIMEIHGLWHLAMTC